VTPNPADANSSAATEPPRDYTDLGFGRVVADQVRGRFLNRDGTPTSRKYGLGPQRIERFYLAALALSFPSFIAWALGALLLLNGVFAFVYLSLGSGALQGGEALGLSDPFLTALRFSVGVFTTAGTAPMYAVGSTAHWLVVLESFFGPLALVATSGLLIARLTRPRMRLLFSESAVVAPYEGGRGLMFRFVNQQPGELSDVQVRMSLVIYVEENGKRERDFLPLKLERKSVDLFPLHWTVVHPIDAESPLRGLTPDDLRAGQAEIIVVVSAHEETFSTRVTARASYWHDEIRWDAKFSSIFATSVDGTIAIDVERLSRLDRLEAGTTSVPSPLEGATA
jgi:inward rectifier potassium channel